MIKFANLIRIFVLLCVWFSAMPLHADQTIRVGIHHFEPLVFTDENGQAKGLFADVLNHIAKKENWQIRYVFGTWQECLDRLDSGDIDIIAGIAFSDERAKKFDFTSEYLFLDWTQVYKPEGANIETLFDLEGKTVASLRGSIITHDFKNLVEQFGISCTIVEKDDYNQVAEAVRNKETDAGICMNIRVLHLKKSYDIELTHISFSPQKIRFAVRKGFQMNLLGILDQNIAALKADKHSVYYEFYDKWTDMYRPKNIYPAWLWGAGLTIISISILLLLFVAILKRQVKLRTSELTKTNEVLCKSKEKFRTVADYTYDWEYWIGTDGKFVYVSPSCERITGYRNDEFIHDDKLLEKVIHPEDRKSLSCSLGVESEGSCISDVRMITKSGEERWINHVCHPVYTDKGEWIGRRASNRDITDRKQMEDKLRESEEKYRAMYDNAPLAYQSLNEDGRFLDVNPMWLKALGYDREEVIGKWFGDFLHPDLVKHFKINFPAFKQRGYVSDVRFRMRRKDGNFIIVSFEGCVGYTPEGLFKQSYCTFKDISREYEAEKALRESERRFKTVVEQSPLGIAVVDGSGNLTECNRSLEKIVGYSCGELTESNFADFTYPDDLPEERELIRQLWNGEIDHYVMEKRYIRKDGSLIWVNVVCSVIRDEQDHIEAGFAFVQDITERKQAEEAVRESEKRLRNIFDNVPIGMFQSTPEGKFIYINPAISMMLGYDSPDELIRKVNQTSIAAALYEDPDRRPLLVQEVEQNQGFWKIFENRYRCKDGHIIDAILSFCEQTEPLTGQRFLYGFVQDITDRKYAEKALQDSEKKYRSLAENSRDYIMRYDKECRHLYMNQAGLKVSGLVEEDIIGKTHREAGFDEKLSALWEEKIVQVFQTGEASQAIFEWESVEGTMYLDWRLFPEFNGNGKVETVLGISRDITEIKQAEQELKKRENLFSKVLEILPIGLWIADKNGKLITANPAGIRIWGAAPYVGQEEYRVFKARRLPSGQEIAPDDWALVKTIRQGITISDELLEIDAFDGQKKIILNYTAPVFGDDGSIQGAIVVNQDITERKRAEEMLRESQYRLNLALRSANMGVWELDILRNTRYFDNRSCRFLGINPADFTGTSEEFFNIVHSDDREMIRTMLAMTIESSAMYDPEYRVVLPDGAIRHIKAIGSLHCDDAGNPLKISGILWDMTEQKSAEEEKAKLEARIRQAQSMEAIGTLAGGIAHDFNNILFPIIGYTEMTLDDIPKESRAHKNLQEVYKAAMRAKDLVGQILTFSRQREQEKTIFKLHYIVKEALKLIRSTLPSTIIISQNIDPNCDPVQGDPTQVHQILMNLCTNAYHAMMDTGGELRVTLTEIELTPKDITAYPGMAPGAYLKLSVTDTGVGIPENILGKIFDPFFTTKPVGKGTGLGLSVVHGIVKQMGGDIRVYSEKGVGTTFVIHIPAVRSLPSDTEQSVTPNTLIPTGTEHILLVDDEEPILAMLGRMLEELGYRITPRTSSIEAFNAFQNKPDSFDIVITDMTMPNMTGVQLAGKIMEIRADIPIILCTGFSEQISREKAKHAGIRGYLMKPVIRADMAKMIRKVLEEVEKR